MEPPTDAISIGGDHFIVYAEYENEPAGITEWHRRPDNGEWCCGWVAFAGSAWVNAFNGNVTSWEVRSSEPLTLSPSILCRACGNHGFIRAGRWVPA